MNNPSGLKRLSPLTINMYVPVCPFDLLPSCESIREEVRDKGPNHSTDLWMIR